MKLKTSFFVAACFLSISLSAVAEEVLFDESFENPTGLTYVFPPAQGQPFVSFHKGLSAWANNEGRIEVNYAEGVGEDKTGGITCKVVQMPTSGGYLGFNCEAIKVPISSADDIEKVLNAFELDFAIKVPTGKTVNVYLQASSKMFPADPVLKEQFRGRAFPERATFPKINGNDDFTKYTYKCSELPSGSLDMVTQYLKELYKSGALDLELVVAWNISGPDWTDGTEFSIDNIKISLDR